MTDATGNAEPFRPTVHNARLAANWRVISAQLDAPRPGVIERSLRRAGLPSRVTRLVVATPALRRAWFASIAVVVIVGLGATNPDDPRQSLFTLLLLAPMIPLLGVSLAYGPSADPAYELQVATPGAGLRLLVIRSVTVLGVSIVVVTPLAFLSEVARPMALAWLLPALAVTTAALAAMTALSPRRSAIVVAAGWIGVVLVARTVNSDSLAAFGPLGQGLAVVAAMTFGVVTVVRRGRFDHLRVAS